jgi:hypothetical protein
MKSARTKWIKILYKQTYRVLRKDIDNINRKIYFHFTPPFITANTILLLKIYETRMVGANMQNPNESISDTEA